jgi:hypothetical protein
VRKRGRARGAHARRAGTTVATRTVAAGVKPAREGAGGLVTLVLKLAKPYRALSAKAGGLSSNVTLTFAAPGHRTLRERVAVTFRRKPKARRSAARTKRVTHSPSGQGGRG